MAHGEFGSFIEELQARTEIEDVLKRYCRAVDRSDWDLLRTVYHEDAYDDHGMFKGTVEEFITYDIERREHIEHSVHMISNIQIDFRGTELAVVETYCLALQRFRAGSDLVKAGSAGARIQAICRYVDRFERRQGAWRIGHRTMVSGDLLIDQYSAPVVFSSERAVQQPDRGDILYRMLEEWR